MHGERFHSFFGRTELRRVLGPKPCSPRVVDQRYYCPPANPGRCSSFNSIASNRRNRTEPSSEDDCIFRVLCSNERYPINMQMAIAMTAASVLKLLSSLIVIVFIPCPFCPQRLNCRHVAPEKQSDFHRRSRNLNWLHGSLRAPNARGWAAFWAANRSANVDCGKKIG